MVVTGRSLTIVLFVVAHVLFSDLSFADDPLDKFISLRRKVGLISQSQSRGRHEEIPYATALPAFTSEVEFR